MSVQNNVAIIQEILANLDNPYDEKNLQIIHQTGYLIGLLARLANNDSQVYYALKQELARVKSRKKKK